jgi:alkylation response protein AidB-like acyl-CoA dehydrogenase
MDFRFSDEQLALQESVRAFCAQHYDLANIAARDGVPADAGTWRALADIGVFGLVVPVSEGGFGGVVDAAIVFEQLGAHLASGPVLWSTIAAPFVPAVLGGALRVSGVEVDAATSDPVVIEHAAESDVVVLVDDETVRQIDASALSQPAESGDPLDPLTPAVAYAQLPVGDVVGGVADVRRLRLVGTVCSSAMLVGVAQGALDVASNYALERRQFGVPIGSFQAIKHLLADMYVRTELARSATYAAAAITDDERAGDAVKAASSAKVLAGDAGSSNGRTAVQLLGGMGFTWEMLPHYFLKRSWVLEHAFGTGDAHALALSRALESEVAAG